MVRDEDATQDAMLYIVSAMSSFIVRRHDGFSRWIRTIARRRRQSVIPRRISKQTDQLDDEIHLEDDQQEYHDLTGLPESIAPIALALVHGDSVEEIAERMGVKPRTVEKKVERYCRKTAA